MNVVIFAAGRGERYKETTRQINILTKCLIKLNGETVLERQIRLLKKNGLTDITVVVPLNFPQEKYNVKYRIIDVPSSETSVTWTMQHCLDLIHDTFILCGDVVFNRKH